MRGTEVVPERMLNAFVEAELASELYHRWENHASDILPQFENVSEGDWEAAGYDMKEEFPQVSMLANNYGKEWKAFLSRRDDQSDIVWVISNDSDYDDFQTLMGDFLDDREWTDIETKDNVEKAIKEFQDIVRNSRDDDDGDDDGGNRPLFSDGDDDEGSRPLFSNDDDDEASDDEGLRDLPAADAAAESAARMRG